MIAARLVRGSGDHQSQAAPRADITWLTVNIGF